MKSVAKIILVLYNKITLVIFNKTLKNYQGLLYTINYRSFGNLIYNTDCNISTILIKYITLIMLYLTNPDIYYILYVIL